MQNIYSQPRLKTYSDILDIHSKNSVNAHHWNTLLSASLYPILQTFELTLRNSLNHAVINSNNSPTLYKHDPWWFQHLTTAIQNTKIQRMNSKNRAKWVYANGGRKQYSHFERNIHRAKKELRDQERPITADAVLSRQTFGFWTKMLTSDFSDPGTHTRLWPNLLTDVFPNANITLSTTILEQRANSIKDIRNRISHHEPVWKFHNSDANGNIDYSSPVTGIKASLKALREQYAGIMEYIKWMSIPAYNEIIRAGLNKDFEGLSSIEGFYRYMNEKNPSLIRHRINLYTGQNRIIKLSKEYPT